MIPNALWLKQTVEYCF